MQRRRLRSKPTRSVSDNIASGVLANPITPPLVNHFRIIVIRRERGARMNSPCAPSLWRGFQLFLGKQASLPACFVRLVFWLIVTGFSLITSPSLFAQTSDNTATVGGRIAGQARTPALHNATIVRGCVRRCSSRRGGHARQSGDRAETRRNHGRQRQFRFRSVEGRALSSDRQRRQIRPNFA